MTVFITGTDTGVGKTAFSYELVKYWREKGYNAIGLKPISTGGREDAIRLWEASDRRTSLDNLNPFYFSEPMAPAIAAELEGKFIHLMDVQKAIAHMMESFSHVVIEGIGGWLTPISRKWLLRDLVQILHCSVVIVAHTRLGYLNHTFLTIENILAADVSIKGLVLNQYASLGVVPMAIELIETRYKIPIALIDDFGKSPFRCPQWLEDASSHSL